MNKFKVDFTDNSPKAKAQIRDNSSRALYAMGLKAVELIVKKMDTGYLKRIWLTGDLMRSIAFRVNGDDVDVGSNLDYAEKIHNGTSKIPARPYIRDGIMENKDELQEIAESYLSDGF